MSNDPIRLTFADGTQLYGYGDTFSFCFYELFQTAGAAEAHYSNKGDGGAGILETALAQIERAWTSMEEVVKAETTYGTLDHSYQSMNVQAVFASKKELLVTKVLPYGSV